MKPAALTERGFVYLSLDGDVPNNPLSSLYTIEYMRSSKDNMDTLLNAIKEVNPKLKVIRVNRTEELNKDAAVLQLRNTQSNPQLDSQPNSQLTCPTCQSVQVEFIGNQRKSFSVGKAVAGGLLTGGYGALAGFAGKKGNDRWHCKNCGNIFETKPR